MPRYIDAEKMPNGPLWDELTDKEKLNVLHYLLSSSSSDIIRSIFEDIEELNSSIVDGQMFFFTNKLSEAEWLKLCVGYKKITGEVYNV